MQVAFCITIMVGKRKPLFFKVFFSSERGPAEQSLAGQIEPDPSQRTKIPTQSRSVF